MNARAVLFAVTALHISGADADAPPDTAAAAGPVTVAIEFLSDVRTLDVYVGFDSFVAWSKPYIAGLKRRFAAEPNAFEAVVQWRLQPTGPAELLLAARPAFSESVLGHLERELRLPAPPAT